MEQIYFEFAESVRNCLTWEPLNLLRLCRLVEKREAARIAYESAMDVVLEFESKRSNLEAE
jgi:hypothetical protein